MNGDCCCFERTIFEMQTRKDLLVMERHPFSLTAKQKETINAYIFLVPMLLILGMLIIYPILATYKYTLYNWTGLDEPDQYVGLKNFIIVAKDPYFWNAVKNSLIYTAVLVPIQLTLALVLAVLLNNTYGRMTAGIRSLFFVPVVTTPAIIGAVFWMLLNPVNGPLSQVFGLFGIGNGNLDLLGNPSTALWAIIGVGIWQTLGLNIIYFLAGLQSIPKGLYEAATVDGANGFQKFTQITLPLLRPVTIIVLLLAILGSLQVFDTVQVMTGGGPFFATDVVQTYIFRFAFGGEHVKPAVGYASAAALFMGFLTMGLTICQFFVAKRLRK